MGMKSRRKRERLERRAQENRSEAAYAVDRSLLAAYLRATYGPMAMDPALPGGEAADAPDPI